MTFDTLNVSSAFSLAARYASCSLICATVAFLRVEKLDFTGYYYNAVPVIIQPVQTELEGAESEHE